MESNLDKARKIIFNPNFRLLKIDDQKLIMQQILASGVTKEQLEKLLIESTKPQVNNQKEEKETLMLSQLNDVVNNSTFSTLSADRKHAILERFRKDLSYDQNTFNNLVTGMINQNNDEFSQIMDVLAQHPQDTKTPLNKFVIGVLSKNRKATIEEVNRIIRENWGNRVRPPPQLFGSLTGMVEVDLIYSEKVFPNQLLIELKRNLAQLQDPVKINNVFLEGLINRYGITVDDVNYLLRQMWREDPVPIYTPPEAIRQALINNLNANSPFAPQMSMLYDAARIQLGMNLDEFNRFLSQNWRGQGFVRRLIMDDGVPLLLDVNATRQQLIDELNAPRRNEFDRNMANFFNEERQNLGMSLEEFNQFLQDNWRGRGRIEFIIQRGIPSFRIGIDVRAGDEEPMPNVMLLNQRRRNNAGPRPAGELVDDEAALVEIGDLLGMINTFAERELDKYGRNGVLIEDLGQLLNDMGPYLQRFAAANLHGRSVGMPLNVYLELLQGWKTRFNELIQLDRTLGRRCQNTHTPINEEPIEDVPDGEIIRLENGICWDIDTLTDYIREKKGENVAKDLRNYPTRTIWENDDDLARILRHERSNQRGFTQWFMNKNIAEHVGNISNETLNRMIIAASLLSSRGQSFRQAMQRELAQKPKLLEAWRQVGENPNDTYLIKNKEIRHDIEQTIAITLKSLAVVDFLNYYDNQITQEERNALDAIEPTFAKELRMCQRGEHCVFGMARTLQTLRNQIAGVKGIPFIDLGIE